MRALLMTLSLIPYIYFAAKDHSFHMKQRKVTFGEHFLHACLGLVLITAIGNAYADHQVIFVLGMAVFVAAGAWDEYYYHREIPGEESDLHAKEHFGLFTFVVVTLSTSWLEAHQWQFSELLPGRK